MPRKNRDVSSGLKTKGFIEDADGHHIYYFLHDSKGKKTTVRTYMSHQNSGAELSDNLLGKMARQVRLSKKDFLNLIDCPLSRDEYLKMVGDEI